MASAATTNTTGRDVVGTSVYGEGPKALRDRVQTLRFVFHNFKGMDDGERGHYLAGPPLESFFGKMWELQVYPRGIVYPRGSIDEGDSDTDTEGISVYLKYIGDGTISSSAPTRFVFRCKDYTQSFNTHVFPKGEMCGNEKFLERRVLEHYLEFDGSLTIEVDLQLEEDGTYIWYPTAIPTEIFLKECYMNATLSSSNNPTEEEIGIDTTDVVFVVDKNEFPVHESVLAVRAKTLYSFCNGTTVDDTDADGRARVHIPDIKSDTFKKLVEFIYTVNTTPTLIDAAAATALLLAAHRFESVSLQLYVESVLVDKFVTPTNAAAMLQLGNTYNCALLTEVAMESCATNDTVRAGTNTNAVVVDGEDDTTRTMNVGDLRDYLEWASLGLDGSRKMLVNRYLQRKKEKPKTTGASSKTVVTVKKTKILKQVIKTKKNMALISKKATPKAAGTPSKAPVPVTKKSGTKQKAAAVPKELQTHCVESDYWSLNKAQLGRGMRNGKPKKVMSL